MGETPDLRVLHFMVKNIQYCLNIEHVECGMFLMALQTVPGGPADLAGLMNLHGKSVPVLDVTIRAGLTPDQPYDTDTSMLLCAYRDSLVGLIVTKIIGVEDAGGFSRKFGAVAESTTLPVTGVINTERGLSLLLDIKPLLADIAAYNSDG